MCDEIFQSDDGRNLRPKYNRKAKEFSQAMQQNRKRIREKLCLHRNKQKQKIPTDKKK